MRDNGGRWWAFAPSGSWLGTGAGPGSAVLTRHDRTGRIVGLAHERGRSIEIVYAGGRVTCAGASDGRRVDYRYDEAGRLVGVADAVGARTYEWNDAGLISRVVSAAGVVECENLYDETGRVVEQLTSFGRRVRFAYLPGRVTAVSDAGGANGNTWIADVRGRLVGVIDADDKRQSMAYDGHGNLVSVIERDGSVTVHVYDERGRKTRTVTPDGADITYGYDEHDRLLTVVTASGGVVEYGYDADSDRDPSVIVDPCGGRTRLSWRDGLLERVVDPTGVVVSLAYDGHGELIETTNAVGGTARIERDPAGRGLSPRCRRRAR
ncbi:RHS repeat protein [Leifsonia xyli]|uniref:RHS repeat protein n=1 Tax=Leifsonia xyli TaxID=1575 RepID=UPI00146FC155|nr:RHS repeat protein [Leifsonia xyli]